MHDILKTAWQNPLRTLKIAGGIIVTLLVLTIAFQFISNTLRSVGFPNRFGSAAPSYSAGGIARYDAEYGIEEDAMNSAMAKIGGMPTPMPPNDGGFSSGNDAEDFEVTEYNGTIQTNDKEPVCTILTDLKAHEYVIFENTNNHTTGCTVSFKVEHEHTQEILTIIEDLQPENLSASSYTIKRSIENTTSEVEILQQKLTSINETLQSALVAYDEITKLATATRDAASLATIIDGKVRLIERLTQERININERLDRLEKNKAQQMERLEYTYFYVYVYEDKFVDTKRIKDSWKSAIQSFVHESNALVQEITIGIVVFLLTLVQYVLYFVILLFTAKFGWKFTRRVWKQ